MRALSGGAGVGLAGLLLWAGCAGGPRVPVRTGDADATPSMECLPSLDVDEAELTKEMRMARMLSAESLHLPSPSLPSGRSAQEIQRWSEETLAPWLEQKQARAEAARAGLDQAAVQNHRQRIMAGALVGLVYEDVAQGLLRLPAPSELDSEPEVRAMYHELMQEQAAPYLRHAQLGYEACAENAKAQRRLAHWSPFCAERASHLPAQEALAPGESQTTVTITRD